MELDVIELEIILDALCMLRIQENINHALKMKAEERNDYLLTGNMRYSEDEKIRKDITSNIIDKVSNEIEVKKNGKEVG